jgi:hypothetical protein
MPSLRSPAGYGYGAAYGLGLFSGIASACCAPVLAGGGGADRVVGVVRRGAGSQPDLRGGYGGAAGGAGAGVGGQGLGASKLLHGRRVRAGFGRFRREMPLGTLAAGVLLIAMGVLTLITAVTGPSMSSSGWRETMTAWLQHASSVTARALHWLPGWAVLMVLAALVAALGWAAVRARRRQGEPEVDAAAAAGLPGADGEISQMTAESVPAGQEAVAHER